MNDTPATAPSERLAGFAALLREHGLTVGVAEQQAMLQAAVRFGPLQERSLQAAWRAIACHSHREWKLWPDVYERFWHPEKLRGGVKVSGQTRASHNLRQSVQALVAGDVDDGEFTLEESHDGLRIAATWLGTVVPASCGQEIRGTWRPEPGQKAYPFVLKKLPARP